MDHWLECATTDSGVAGLGALAHGGGLACIIGAVIPPAGNDVFMLVCRRARDGA